MKLFVVPNLMSKEQIEVAKDCINSLIKSLNASVSLSKDNSRIIFNNEEFSLFSVSDCDYIVSIGGDACVLKAARIAIEHNKPLVGINAGRLGYLCAFRASEISELNESSFSSLKLTRRSLLKVEKDGKEYLAINDVIIGKSNFGKVIEVSVSCNDDFLARWRGDGVIVASPTGSTAYNQSAGGIELKYDEQKFAVTPICPHRSCSKAMVVDDSSKLVVSSVKTPENSPTIYIDGLKISELNGSILITKSNKELVLCTK